MQRCWFVVETSRFGLDSCPGEPKYLEIVYSCIEGIGDVNLNENEKSAKASLKNISVEKTQFMEHVHRNSHTVILTYIP